MTTIRQQHIRYGVLDLDDGRELRLAYTDESQCGEHLVTERADGKIVVTYMVSDPESSDSPMDDCSGWQDFRVLHSQSDADDLSRLLSDCAECGEHAVEHDDTTNHAYVSPPAQVAMHAGRAFLFEKYEHGLVRYALRGESSQVDRQWDVSPVAGFIWADDDWGDGVDIEEAARASLAEYTSWCNGDIWGVVTEIFTPTDDGFEADSEDACWGYIGSGYAEQTMKDEHASYLEPPS